MGVPPLLNEIFHFCEVDNLVRKFIKFSVLEVEKSGLLGSFESAVDITPAEDVVLLRIFEKSLVLLTPHKLILMSSRLLETSPTSDPILSPRFHQMRV